MLQKLMAFIKFDSNCLKFLFITTRILVVGSQRAIKQSKIVRSDEKKLFLTQYGPE